MKILLIFWPVRSLVGIYNTIITGLQNYWFWITLTKLSYLYKIFSLYSYSQLLIIYLLPSAVSCFTYFASLNPLDNFARWILLALFSLVPCLISSVGGRAGFPSLCLKALFLNSPLYTKGNMNGTKNNMKAPSSLELNGFHIKFNYSGPYH